MKSAMVVLEFDKIKEELARCAMSYRGKHHVEMMEPFTEPIRIERSLRESQEALAIIVSGGSVPIPSLEGLERVEQMLGKGYVFTATDFEAVGQFIKSTLQLQQYLRRKREIAPTVSSYAESLYDLATLKDEIDSSIYLGDVIDTASDGLHRARKQETIIDSRLRKKLDSALQKYRSYLQESMVLQRGNRYVLAVRKDQKRMVPGSVIDESSSGQTVFIEPSDVSLLQQELDACRAEVEQEKYQVLCNLSALLDSCHRELKANLETIGVCDFVIAKGKYGRIIDGRKVHVNRRGIIDVHGARHPLLGKQATPIDFRMGNGYRALIITGPNTGGKTVCLKTVGLLTLMMQCGLLVPANEGSEMAIFEDILADIGDGQSISQSLSTFSAHVRSLVDILARANSRTLVLLDELASGTDPGEGIGLSIAVLERLFTVGSSIAATTHFSEIKDFAQITKGFEVARMEFDVESLQPLYRLRIGEAGESYALLIAKKLGIEEDLIRRAEQIVSTGREGAKDDKRGLAMKAREVTEVAETHRATEENLQEQPPKKNVFQVGDRVWIHAMKRSGIVASLPDDKGNLKVMVQKQPIIINHKRIAPYLTKEQLYPDTTTYDLDIVLESKENRKKRKLMGKRHVEGLTIEESPSE